MMNIHLIEDDKFLNQTINNFEKYYPNKNVFLLGIKNNEDVKYISPLKSVILLDYKKSDVTEKIIYLTGNSEEVNVFVHFLTPEKAKIVEDLRKHVNLKSFWIFFGADLYNHLFKLGKYELYDRNLSRGLIKRNISKFFRIIYFSLVHGREFKNIKLYVRNLDFFCFWNYYDYQLLKKSFKTSAEFKWFSYSSAQIFQKSHLSKRGPLTVMVNQSGSFSGNHLTILRKLNSDVKENIQHLIVPLNYGPKENIQKINNFCTENFRNSYKPILTFMEKGEYFKIVEGVDIAFFGHLRQEGAGNINYLLATGAKVYLRERNNLFSYYKNLGITIFSFENDFKSDKDLMGLDYATQRSNRRLILKDNSTKKYLSMYLDLLK